MSTFFERIAERYEELSSNEQLVIDMVMRARDVDHLKIKTITDELFVSSATVMRAARKLGYANFSQLKYSAASAQAEHTAPLPSEDFGTITGRIISEFDKTMQMLNVDKVAEFVDYLNGARRIFCVGSGSSVSVVSDLTRKLKLLDYWVNDYNELYSIRDIADLAQADDVIVILSLGGGNDLVNQFLVRAKATGAKIISITGVGADSVAKFSDCNMLVYQAPVPRKRMRSRLMLNVAIDVVFEYILSHPRSQK
ncbi:MurR/RpiR family transcriptional regulator [Lacticaseibacillus porcinae]|uniref:MurR/RpiR family transcriptional regulator n=1 Tax=Lacticaseibacillus porcinae TaxID=1123687 RepID=UPI000F7AF6CA|nr:MurR/RpiR family transcriptional regulator [Lacticaseibacillus porcinae]